jgi:hypothetical protein
MNLTKLSDSEIASLRSEFPNVPSDYFDFLANQGYGEIPDGLTLYSGPVSPTSILGRRAEGMSSILLIPDDLTGTSYGFDASRNWTIVSVDSCDMSVPAGCRKQLSPL